VSLIADLNKLDINADLIAARRTLPSMAYCTSSVRPSSAMGLLAKAFEESAAITPRCSGSNRPSCVIISSVRPALK
jgi:hypothetical protein